MQRGGRPSRPHLPPGRSTYQPAPALRANSTRGVLVPGHSASVRDRGVVSTERNLWINILSHLSSEEDRNTPSLWSTTLKLSSSMLRTPTPRGARAPPLIKRISPLIHGHYSRGMKTRPLLWRRNKQNGLELYPFIAFQLVTGYSFLQQTYSVNICFSRYTCLVIFEVRHICTSNSFFFPFLFLLVCVCVCFLFLFLVCLKQKAIPTC